MCVLFLVCVEQKMLRSEMQWILELEGEEEEKISKILRKMYIDQIEKDSPCRLRSINGINKMPSSWRKSSLTQLLEILQN